MVYTMEFKVDGACRGNGQPGATGAAAACLFLQNGSYYVKSEPLPYGPVPTNQRAEIYAIVMALEWAKEKYQGLSTAPYLDVTISSDSRYAVDSMNKRIAKWIDNGWYNSAGRPVANRDLFERACRLGNEISRIGEVSFVWIPREDNQEADIECNEVLDDME